MRTLNLRCSTSTASLLTPSSLTLRSAPAPTNPMRPTRPLRRPLHLQLMLPPLESLVAASRQRAVRALLRRKVSLSGRRSLLRAARSEQRTRSWPRRMPINRRTRTSHSNRMIANTSTRSFMNVNFLLNAPNSRHWNVDCRSYSLNTLKP